MTGSVQHNAESIRFEATVEVQVIFTVAGQDWAPSRVAQEIQEIIDGTPTIEAVAIVGRRVQSLSYKVVDNA